MYGMHRNALTNLSKIFFFPTLPPLDPTPNPIPCYKPCPNPPVHMTPHGFPPFSLIAITYPIRTKYILRSILSNCVYFFLPVRPNFIFNKYPHTVYVIIRFQTKKTEKTKITFYEKMLEKEEKTEFRHDK